MNEGFRNFRPPGPVTTAFLADTTSLVRALLGPVGGGKTVTCIFDALKNASAMPICRDKIIHYRQAVIGTTYGQLERNLYPTWHSWLPADGGSWTEGEWEGGGGRFARQWVHFNVLRGGSEVHVKAEFVFAAVGEQSVEAFMRGFEPTSFYLYEMDQLPQALLTNAIGRLDRYPSVTMLPPGVSYRSYIVGDLNAPDTDSWFYDTFEEKRPPGHRLYRQPSGLSAQAENIRNLKAGYYQRLADANAANTRWVRRFVHAQYGPPEAGEPVFPEWADDRHLAPEPLLYKKSGLLLGFDQDLHAACVICERTSVGQLRVLAEVYIGRAGPRKFSAAVRDALRDVAPNADIIGAWCDPSGFEGVDREDGDLAWAEIVERELGISIQPAPSNEIELRLTSVRDELTYQIDGETPALLVSPRCKMVRKGMVSHYLYEKRPAIKSQSRKPVKNIWANIQDALQYVCLGEKGRFGAIEGKRDARAAERQIRDGDQLTTDSGCVVLKAPVVV